MAVSGKSTKTAGTVVATPPRAVRSIRIKKLTKSKMRETYNALYWAARAASYVGMGAMPEMPDARTKAILSRLSAAASEAVNGSQGH
jgi:hypothetical protein